MTRKWWQEFIFVSFRLQNGAILFHIGPTMDLIRPLWSIFSTVAVVYILQWCAWLTGWRLWFINLSAVFSLPSDRILNQNLAYIENNWMKRRQLASPVYREARNGYISISSESKCFLETCFGRLRDLHSFDYFHKENTSRVCQYISTYLLFCWKKAKCKQWTLQKWTGSTFRHFNEVVIFGARDFLTRKLVRLIEFTSGVLYFGSSFIISVNISQNKCRNMHLQIYNWFWLKIYWNNSENVAALRPELMKSGNAGCQASLAPTLALTR